MTNHSEQGAAIFLISLKISYPARSLQAANCDVGIPFLWVLILCCSQGTSESCESPADLRLCDYCGFVKQDSLSVPSVRLVAITAFV